MDDDFRRSSKALSLSGVSFVCLIDWESEEERESEKEASGCWIKFLLAYSFTHGVFSLLLLLRLQRRQRRQEMDALIGGWLAGWL